MKLTMANFFSYVQIDSVLRKNLHFLVDCFSSYNLISLEEVTTLKSQSFDLRNLEYLFEDFEKLILLIEEDLKVTFGFSHLLKLFSSKKKLLAKVNFSFLELKNLFYFFKKFKSFENLKSLIEEKYSYSGQEIYFLYDIKENHLKLSREFFVRLNNMNFDGTSYYRVFFDSFSFSKTGEIIFESKKYLYQQKQYFKGGTFIYYSDKELFIEALFKELMKLSLNENPLKLPFFGIRVLKSNGEFKKKEEKSDLIILQEYRKIFIEKKAA